VQQDIRWQQRFSNYKKALAQLKKFIDKGDLSELEKQGLVKAFEYTYELAWNTIKDFLEYQGKVDIIGSRDTFREAFTENIIIDGEEWMNMLKSRNLTIHTYNQETADEIYDKVFNSYFQLFCDLKQYFDQLINKK
jgi:nucleotidyltransferase substrate binding protein (TIGR01987 family)